MSRSIVKYILGIVGMCIGLWGCKKYKENMLILESPYLAIERWKHMKIQYIKVDEVDCTAYYKQKVPLFNESFKSEFLYNNFGDRKIFLTVEGKRSGSRGSLLLWDGLEETCSFNIGSVFPLTDPVGKPRKWDILKLNHKEFKIRKYETNGKVYEVYLAR